MCPRSSSGQDDSTRHRALRLSHQTSIKCELTNVYWAQTRRTKPVGARTTVKRDAFYNETPELAHVPLPPFRIAVTLFC